MLQDLAEIFQLHWPDSFLQSSVLAVQFMQPDIINLLFHIYSGFWAVELRL